MQLSALVTQAIVFGNDNLRCKGGVIYAPIYMVMFLQKLQLPNLHYKVDLSAIQ